MRPKTLYRILNGRKAAGHPKNFSQEEIDRRILLLKRARLVRMGRRQSLARKREEMKRLVKEAASRGVFIPVQDFE